jgi:hypothetical protein
MPRWDLTTALVAFGRPLSALAAFDADNELDESRRPQSSECSGGPELWVTTRSQTLADYPGRSITEAVHLPPNYCSTGLVRTERDRVGRSSSPARGSVFFRLSSGAEVAEMSRWSQLCGVGEASRRTAAAYSSPSIRRAASPEATSVAARSVAMAYPSTTFHSAWRRLAGRIRAATMAGPAANKVATTRVPRAMAPISRSVTTGTGTTPR